VGVALTLATATAVGNGYMIGIAIRLAHMNGWTEEQGTAIRTGTPTRDAKIDVLTGLIREAAASSGNVTHATWKAAQQAGWSDEQLTDAFAYLGATQHWLRPGCHSSSIVRSESDLVLGTNCRERAIRTVASAKWRTNCTAERRSDRGEREIGSLL
jgi:hypothetical protein